MGFEDDCRAVAEDRTALAELRIVAPLLMASASPCGARAVVAALVPLTSLYGIQTRSEAEWKTFWKFYIDALEALPLEALKRGIADYVGDAKSEFFPKPGPLKALCEAHASGPRMAALRAKFTLEIANQRKGL